MTDFKLPMRKEPEYIKWLSAEMMHEDSITWLSELNFIEDELLFFQDLIRDYTMELIKPAHFNDSDRMVHRLSDMIKTNKALIKSVHQHERGLKFMVDGIDQLKEERDYKNVHRKLISQMSTYLDDYRTIKSQIYDLMKLILKEGKERRLLGKKVDSGDKS